MLGEDYPLSKKSLIDVAFAPTGHRVIWLIWFLVFLGVLLGVLTLGLRGNALLEVQTNKMVFLETGAAYMEIGMLLDQLGVQAVNQLKDALKDPIAVTNQSQPLLQSYLSAVKDSCTNTRQEILTIA